MLFGTPVRIVSRQVRALRPIEQEVDAAHGVDRRRRPNAEVTAGEGRRALASQVGAIPAVMTIAQNTLYGNGVLPQSPPTNCGLVIQNSGAETLTVDAGGNYWGAASGPGADPADAAGGLCSAGAVVLDLTGWASSEIKVKAPTMN